MAKIAGQDVDIQPLNREEQFYDEIAQKTDAALTPTITEPSDGDVIKYDATTGKWVNGEGGGSGGGGILVVNATHKGSAYVLDKTAAEISSAANSNAVIMIRATTESGSSISPAAEVYVASGGEYQFVVSANSGGNPVAYMATAEDAYPQAQVV
jgi:hypothetical protein